MAGCISIVMSGNAPVSFHCPECNTAYKIVRIPKPEADTLPSQSLFCVICDQPLAPEADGFLLKYFMVGRSISHLRKSRPKTQSAPAR